MKQQTKEYDRFKIYAGNRPIDKANLESLMQSISERNLLQERPILVNENFEILDGQHRLEVAKTLQIPIFYEIKTGGNYEDIIYLNGSQKNWKTEDYLRLYSEGQKKENYTMLDKFIKDHDLKLSIALLINNGPIKEMSDYDKFKKGNFVFNTNIEYMETTVKRLKTIWNLILQHNIKPFYRFKNTSFVKPLLILFDDPKFVWEILLQKLESNWFKIGTRPSTALYIEMFCDIYNYRNQNKIYYEALQKNN